MNQAIIMLNGLICSRRQFRKSHKQTTTKTGSETFGSWLNQILEDETRLSTLIDVRSFFIEYKVATTATDLEKYRHLTSKRHIIYLSDWQNAILDGKKCALIESIYFSYTIYI